MSDRAKDLVIEYRMATRKDLPQLAQMRWAFRTGPDEPAPVVSKEAFLAACEAFLARGLGDDQGLHGDWVYWIAVHEGQIVSHIFVHLFRSVPKPSQLVSRYGYMTNVYTRPSYRNRGIGSELMRHVKRWAQEQNVPFIIVSPSERSVPFYRRAGFTFETEFMELFLDEQD
jgi:GNAT superfamily N-acetyltransferase